MFKTFPDPVVSQKTSWQDYLVDQCWADFSPEDHDTWDILTARQTSLLQGRIVSPFLEGLAKLGLANGGIPELGTLNSCLQPLTGWRCVAVGGLVPDAAFFAMLADKVFPIGNFIRKRAQLDYLEEPDCFHDIFGHVPMLAHEALAAAMQRFGEEGVRAIACGRGDAVARMYWHTIEFGLVRENGITRILGAGLASSFGEAIKSLDDPTIERRPFSAEEAIATPYRHDEMQPLYLVADSLDLVVRTLGGTKL